MTMILSENSRLIILGLLTHTCGLRIGYSVSRRHVETMRVESLSAVFINTISRPYKEYWGQLVLCQGKKLRAITGFQTLDKAKVFHPQSTLINDHIWRKTSILIWGIVWTLHFSPSWCVKYTVSKIWKTLCEKCVYN